MDDNGTAMGRMSVAVLAMGIILTCAFIFFSWFLNYSREIRDTDTQRRQQQKDSISVNCEFNDLYNTLYHTNIG